MQKNTMLTHRHYIGHYFDADDVVCPFLISVYAVNFHCSFLCPAIVGCSPPIFIGIALIMVVVHVLPCVEIVHRGVLVAFGFARALIRR